MYIMAKDMYIKVLESLLLTVDVELENLGELSNTTSKDLAEIVVAINRSKEGF